MSLPSNSLPIMSLSPVPQPPSYVTPDSQSSVLNNVFPNSCADNDISDLLRDTFGTILSDNYDDNNVQTENKFYKELDQNLLAEIFDDIQSAVKKEDKSSVKKETINQFKSEKVKFEPSFNILNIQKEIEHKIEQDRVDRLRKPKFQTMPAYQKRAKQEAQWRAAIRAARQAKSLHTVSPYPSPVFRSTGDTSSLHTVVMPILTRDPVNTSTSSLDLTSLDLQMASSALKQTAKPYVTSKPYLNSSKVLMPKIVKSTQMVNTKKHLSAANHFPANSRIFNRSLQQLQCQADAISSAYQNVAAARNQILPISYPSYNPQTLTDSQQADALSGKLFSKTTDITRFLKDVNSNQLEINSTIPSTQSTVNYNNNHVPVQKIPLASYIQTSVVKSSHLPVYSLPLQQVRTTQLLHPVPVVSSSSNSSTQVPRYLLVDVQCATPSVIQRNSSIPTPQFKLPISRPAKKFPSKLPSGPNCHNCHKLARVLPYLAHVRRKQVVSSKMMWESAMVLVCELCGSVVRETVIFGDHMRLGHVSIAHFPSFLNNRQVQSQVVENQNFINIGKIEDDFFW